MNTRRLILFLMLAVLCITGEKHASAFYNPGTGRWLSKDPAGDGAFLSSRPNDITNAFTFLPSVRRSIESNLYAYVVNDPANKIDQLGLDWHHFLSQAVFTQERLKKWGVDINIHDKKYGWELDPKTHTGRGGLHPSGWNKDWESWIAKMEGEGTPITKCAIEDHLENVMKPKYRNFLDLGSPATRDYYSTKLSISRAVTTTTGSLIIFAIAAGELTGSNAQAAENIEELLEKMQGTSNSDEQMYIAAQIANEAQPLFGLPDTVIYSILLYQLGLVK